MKTKKERYDFLAQNWLSEAVKDYAKKNGMTDEQGNYNKTEAIHGLFEKLKKGTDETVSLLKTVTALRNQPPVICDTVCNICRFKGTTQCPRK